MPAPDRRQQPETSAGQGVDAFGLPVIDPTKNVLDKVEDAVQRLDDLRQMEAKYVEQIAELRATHSSEVNSMRETYAEKLRRAEADRINAIRTIDINAVSQAATVSATQATTLAGQVATSAEVLRAQIEQTRIQFATTLSVALEPLQTAIAELRQVQYQQAGERVAQTETKGDTQWRTMAVVAVVGLFLSAGAIVSSAIIAIGIYFATKAH